MSTESDPRAAALWEQYGHLFARHAGCNSRKADDPQEVSTVWAGQEMRVAANYAKGAGADRYPTTYKQAAKCGMAGLSGAKLSHIRANIASMAASRMRAREISDVLRIREADVRAEIKRQREERE